MKKILKGIITSILISQIIFLMIPFNIHAENVGGNSPIIGVNISYLDYNYNKVPYAQNVRLETEQTRWACWATSSTGCVAWQSVGYDDVVDNQITGQISTTTMSTVEAYMYEYDFVFDKSYVGSITFSSSSSAGATTTNTYFVNGSHLILNSITLTTAFTISSYNLRALPDGMISWEFPIESFTKINHAFDNNAELVDFQQNSKYIFPIFRKTGVFIEQWSGANNVLYFVFGHEINFNESNYSNYVDITGGTITEIQTIGYSQTMNIKKYTVKKDSITGNFTFSNKGNYKYIPIWSGSEYEFQFLSTEFALQFGLSNNLLKDIRIIANGTNQSNQSASDLQQSTNTMQDQMDNMVDIESGYNQQFNNSLNNIDFTNPIQNNAGILPAANFVITVFNGLVNNPLSILIIIICILTIGKKVIGK